MIDLRTLCGAKMYGARLWLAVAALQTLILIASCGHHRRSMPTQATAPTSKSGWRPVIGSSGLIYSFGAAPLHAPAYKIPVPVLDVYQSSARPLTGKDATRQTSIAYHPTTHRTVSSAPPAYQPINSYHNPLAFNSGLTYKYVQNFPIDSSLIRNPHNPFARPNYSKYPTKFKQPQQNNALQQLTSIQPIHFGQYQTAKPADIFGKPVESYVRPNEGNKPQSTLLEIFKPEVYKLHDSDTASQSVSQQVKTAQQQSYVGNQPFNYYPHYTFQDALPPSIIGSYGSFGAQAVKGRDPVFPTTKTTYLPPQPTKQTIFNSFSYNPNYKSTPNQFVTTTPRYQTTANHIHYGPTFSDFKITPTPHSKISPPPKIDPNAGAKDSFKPSLQDPFTKQYLSDYNKVTTYKPVQTTTLANNFYDYSFPSQQNAQLQNFYNQQNLNFNYENKKQKIHDSVASSVNEQASQYTKPPNESEDTLLAPHRPTYEVTETTETDGITHSSPASWALTSQSYDYNNQKTTDHTLNRHEYETGFSRPTATPLPEHPDGYAIVTEPEKGYENYLTYDSQLESQSKRPLGDDFEPIAKHKLKDYYHKESPATNDDHNTRQTKKPTDATRLITTVESTTHAINESNDISALPTLPPNKHFKRPNNSEPLDKDRVRKRNKIRRRRPPLANINRNKEETSTRASIQNTETLQTTEPQEIHTIRPRVRPIQSYQPNPTTPSITTDLSSSALPTISPTAPTIVKKKLVQRRPLTTTDRVETTTYFKDDSNPLSSKESSIMKISNRPSFPKLTSSPYDLKTVETPDYTHKQDEKDTPTSDIAVSLTDKYKSTLETAQVFSFHKDVKPIEAKLEPVTSQRYRESTTELLGDNEANNEVTTTPALETTPSTGKGQRPRLRNKYNRTRFNVKDYRSRLSSTTSTTEKPVENTHKIRYPQRRVPYDENLNNEGDNTSERKRFTPKDPRHKPNDTEISEEKEKEIHSIRHRQRQPTADTVEGTTHKISSRIRNGLRRRPTQETTETLNPTTVYNKRLLRNKIKDSEIGESVQDISVTETINYDHKNDITSERSRSESAIMKIADKKHHEPVEHLFEHSKRVSDLTLAASNDYNKPGMFKTVAANSRRIPNYFTIATDDPILPIEAFFPQLNQKKES